MTYSLRSSRLETTANALAEATRGRALIDLTSGNPTAVGIPYAEKEILAALAAPSSLLYEPEPLGLRSARTCVAALYGTAPSRVAITASTSEAYGALFKLYCDPGDEVLVPTPSYPLLEWLAALDSVTLVPYPLVYAGGWHIDLAALRSAVTERTRALVVVSPNNPTGSYLGRDELAAIVDLGLPVISDEVFATYPLEVPEGRVMSALEAAGGTVFTLSGLSKRVGLPQLKLGWIVSNVDSPMTRLETVLDAYLSVGGPVQHALPALLEHGEATARAIRERTRRNLDRLRAAVTDSLASVLEVEGGWYAVLRVPETRTDEAWALRFVEADGVHVQPGYFFDLDRGAHIVVSLLSEPETFDEGVSRILRRIDQET